MITKFTETGRGLKIRKSVRTRVLIKSDLDSNEERGWKTEPRRTLGGDMQIKPRDHFFAGWGLESIFEVGGAAKPGRGGAIQKASQQSVAVPSKPRGGSLSSVGVPLATLSQRRAL